MDALVESRYKLEDTTNGFKVSGKDRHTTYVKFDGQSFYVSERAIPEYVISNNIIGLFEFNKLCKGIVGLADKSIRWHRERRYLADKQYCAYANDTKVKLPSVPLPTSANIRLLKTVGEIFEEGDRMSHCVGSYAVGAVEGKSYIFHVDYDKESATVEVSPGGYVKQARGPYNSSNKATKWAERVLKKWAENLSQIEEVEQLGGIPF